MTAEPVTASSAPQVSNWGRWGDNDERGALNRISPEATLRGLTAVRTGVPIPLGLPLRGRDYGDDTTVKVPGEIDAQRARRILEELRRRFGEAFRPQLELDYIERLLKDY